MLAYLAYLACLFLGSLIILWLVVYIGLTLLCWQRI